MTRRPGFPARLDTKGSQGATNAVPQGVGLDSQAVRQRMVQRLAAEGIDDPQVIAAMTHDQPDNVTFHHRQTTR